MTTRRLMSRSAVAMLAVAGVLGACMKGDLTVPNYSNPTPDAVSADPLTNVQTRVNGILNLGRRNLGWNSDAGLFGRESFVYGTDSRRRSFRARTTRHRCSSRGCGARG